MTMHAESAPHSPSSAVVQMAGLPGSAPLVRVFVVAAEPPMYRRGLAAVIDADPGLEWVGEAVDGPTALDAIATLAPDVVLIDAALVDAPAAGGTVLAQLQTSNPVRVVVLGDDTQAGWPERSPSGVFGTVPKNAPVDVVLGAVHGAARAPAPLPAPVAAPSRQAVVRADLMTRRECQLLDLMARGLSNQDIAQRMDIAVPTVKFHVTNVLAKLQVDNRTAAVLAALRMKLVQLD